MIKNNKLIAEFMEYDTKEDKIGWTANYRDFMFEKSLKYHSSWDWLMPVVGKIERLGYRVEISLTEHNEAYAGIMTKDGTSLVWNVAEEKIEALYKTVIEFIKWYNKEKK